MEFLVNQLAGAVCACAELIVAQYGSLSHRQGPRTELDRFTVPKGPNCALAQLYGAASTTGPTGAASTAETPFPLLAVTVAARSDLAREVASNRKPIRRSVTCPTLSS
jgi:hypothetical protein